MKLIIDIPTNHYNEIVFQDVDSLRECVKNGTVIVNEADVDCVSRKKLLGRIDAERRHLLDIGMDGAEHIIVHHARRIIEDMPAVTPQQRVYDCDFGQEQFEKRRFLNEYLRKWLSSFNTNSATVCFTEIQELKKRVEKENE